MDRYILATINFLGVFIWLHVLLGSVNGAYINLDIADVRLVNGSGIYSGRVEVSINGVWGTLCDNSFDMAEAQVVCKMLNLTASAFATNARFGQGIGPIFAGRVNCGGAESHLRQCTYETSWICSHTQDVGVYCTECGSIAITNGEVYSISPNGSVLTVSCNNGFQSNDNTTVCANDVWSPNEIECVPDNFVTIDGLRLQDGIGLYDGRIEVLINGTWGAICGSTITSWDLRTTCYLLFGTRGFSRYYQTAPGDIPILINKLGCSGYEDYISECSFHNDVSCSQALVATVLCYVYPLNITDIRLADGNGPFDGRVELYVDGYWGTVCRRYIGLYDAMTLCNMMNLSLAAYFEDNIYGEGEGPVLIENLRCYTEENDINSCSYIQPYSLTFCNHNYDLSLVCTPCGPPNIINGIATSFNGSVLTVACQAGSIQNTINMTCLANGTWTREEECSSVSDFPLNISDIRLAGVRWPSEGRVEILVGGTWGTICGRNFNETNAGTICHMFGLTYQAHYTEAKEVNLYGIGTGPIYIDDINCSGTEIHINDCSYELSTSCTHYDDLAVVCTGYQLNITNLRLAGTNGLYHGRVEIEVNNTWGTISDLYFGTSEARTVCAMLGLRYYRRMYNSHYGKGSGPNFIHDLDCVGTQAHINDCRYIVGDSYNQDHSDDISVICYGPTLNITDYRLADGTDPFYGRAEIKVNDTWGTICDANFNIAAAEVFCKQFGLRVVQIFTGAEYGEGSGPIYIEEIFCQTYYPDLSSCSYLYLNSCTHERDISLVCNECGEPEISFWGAGYFRFNGSTLYADCSFYKNYIGTLSMTCDNETRTWLTQGECQEYNYPLDITDIRLVDGSRPSNGRVELKSLGTWGTVCDDSFGLTEANTICAMAGYPHAEAFYTGSHYGDGSGPIFVDDLVCDESSSHINNCTYKTFDDCDHSHDVSVKCTDCGDPTPTNGIVNSTKTGFGTAVRITCKQNYKLVGVSDIVCQLNGTWTNLPECSLIDCGDATPEQGFSNDTIAINGTVLTIWCDEGYELIGDDVITCQSNGQWTGDPECKIKDCELPQPGNASIDLPENKTTYGEYAVISCLTGYTPLGSTSVSCLANGSWEIWPDCEIIDCGDPIPNSATANTTETTYGAVLEITCSPGLNLSGNSKIVCQSDGTWSDNPVCDTTDCGYLSVANGDVDLSNGTTTESVAMVTCNEGFDVQGPTVVRCTRSGWNASVTCVLQVCEDPTPTNGKVTDTDGDGDGYVFGNFATIECDTGYNIQGDSVITCQDGGVWSEKSKCSLVDCGTLNRPIDGTKNDLQGTKYNAKTEFRCKEGFLLVGEETTVCDQTGEWSNEAPICVAKSDNGGSCLSNEYCKMKDSRCVNSVCTCITGIFDNRTETCDKMPLLPFGNDVGDITILKTDVCGPSINFPPGMPVSGKMRKNLYVCSYGFVSFDKQYTNPTPPRNKKRLDFGQTTLIAPFYGPIDKRTSGPVYFRSYDILNTNDKMKDNADVSFIENIVVKFEDLEQYEASFVLIATWHETRPFGIGFDISSTSTFQAVLVSDGKSTYVFYIYGHGLMQWDINDSINTPVWVGFRTDTLDSVSFTHAYSFSPQALRLDSQTLLSNSENDVAGLVFKPLSQQSNEIENDAVDCIRWYNENSDSKKHLDFISSLTPECPCDIWLSRFDPWFWRIGLQRWRTDVTHACVDMLHQGNFGQYGKSCCYDLRTWLWVYERPLAGGFQLYSPRNPVKHIQNDVIPKTKCCVKSSYCNLYYELRPTGSCYVSSSYNYGIFWGDPHFITLDKMNFTFNGLGEFTLLQIRTSNYSLDLQARTERAINKDGNLSDATVFSAFAAKDSSNASFHVELNRAKSGINLYGNTRDLTKQFYESVDSDDPVIYAPTKIEEGSLIISKRGTTVSVLFPTSGVTLNISANVEMLSLNTGLPKSFKGLTKGLLGNYDGNPSNDFILPNGTVLNANLTEREVFEYGKTWAIDPNNSAFIYDEGKTHSDYHNDSYVPRFLDEADPVKRAEAERACNSSQNIECVFDLVFTEKVEIADQTNSIREESDSTNSELEITVPSLTGCTVVNANKGSDVICKLNFESGEEIHFIENNVNAVLDQESSSIIYAQTTNDPVTIRVASKNVYGRYSPAFVINVLFCTNCNGHGACTNQTRDDARGSEHFRYAACECEPQYQGDDCEQDFDGCAANPCSLQRNCTTLSAEEQKMQNRAYVCGPCPSGYKSDNEGDCFDLDECSGSEQVCEHVCINTEGSYLCTCNGGYRVGSKNASKCRDINECEEALHNCTHTCSNIAGGFSCQCYPGYEFDEVDWSCIEVTDGSCNETKRLACSNTSGCATVDGKQECFCGEGYELDESKTLCQDVDECRRDVCPQDCINYIGSFRCECYAGYELQGPTTCKECQIPYWGSNCTQMCVCTGRGAESCDPVKGCRCETGWEGKTCDDDINECSTMDEVCDDPRKSCINTLGSYRCVCKPGFHLTEQGDCEDTDECSDPMRHNCMQTCKNTFGGYSCECENGYTKINDTFCKDIDECVLGTDRCEQRCINNPGLYSCFCHFGYILNDDRETCTKLSDPCLTNNLTCSHFCVLSEAEAACGCQKGYNIEADQETCTDINECEDNTGNHCDSGATCINTAGSFLCECPLGKQLENDGRTCSDCDAFHYGKNCLQTCSCLNGRCDKNVGCICENGWTGNQCDIDINECETGQVTCTAVNTACINLLGGSMCGCKIGFINIIGVCLDIDECDDKNLNSCDQQCTNSAGSYMCTCHKGFILEEGKCIDMDECYGSNACDQNCENTIGGYICSCRDGFKLDLTDRKSCSAETECTDEERKSCPENTSCFVTDDVVSCTCIKGYQSNGDACEDVNECSNNVIPCSQICTNTHGSFLCSCDSGYYLSDDHVTCQECNAWKYGMDCSQDCLCDKQKAESCDTTAGSCVCRPQWEGAQCEEDVDECKDEAACADNSVCRNFDGGYECRCSTGYFKTGTKHCEECDNRRFGDSCLEECTCNFENTDDCFHETGECICKQGWTGVNCHTYIGECEDPAVCQGKANSFCQNYAGSFKCICEDGFLDEDGICIECDDSHYGSNCSKDCLCNKENTESCHHVTGKCSCNEGWTGEVCSVDIDECSGSGPLCQSKANSSCKNTDGSFVCDCNDGFREEGDICTDSRTKTPINWSLIIGISGVGLFVVILAAVLIVGLRYLSRRQSRGNNRNPRAMSSEHLRGPYDQRSDHSNRQRKKEGTFRDTGLSQSTWRDNVLGTSWVSPNNDVSVGRQPYHIPYARRADYRYADNGNRV